MEDLIQLLKTEPNAAISRLTENSKDEIKIKALRDEFLDINRTSRNTQIGIVQKDKWVGPEGKKRQVPSVRVPIPFQNKIVNTAVAFEVGEPITLLPSNNNKFSEEIERLWKYNRIDSILQKLKVLQKSELQSALLFYIEDMNPKNLLNKLLGANKNKQIKVKLLENKNGKMTPYFDSFGDLKYFIWEFKEKKQDGKDERNVWIYDETNVYKCYPVNGKMQVAEERPHGFGKIPVVYLSQDKPEWFISQALIDRIEVSMSKLGASNDYSGHPILLLYGEVKGAPDKDEDGKALRITMKPDEESGKPISGDAKFLTRDGAAESVELELDRLEKYIYSMTSTPDLSNDNMTGMGAISAAAIELMFFDAVIKAKMNEGENRTIIERIINVFVSGTITTTATALKTQAKETYFDIQFNSILPNDLHGTVETLVAAVNGKIMSQQTAIESLDMTNDVDGELKRISSQTEKEKEKIPSASVV